MPVPARFNGAPVHFVWTADVCKKIDEADYCLAKAPCALCKEVQKLFHSFIIADACDKRKRKFSVLYHTAFLGYTVSGCEAVHVKIALAAAGFITGDSTYNKDKIIQLLSKFSGKADMIVFGEAFLQGFNSLCWDFEKDASMAVSAYQPQFGTSLIDEIRSAARKNNIAVSFGYIERDGDTLYSSQLTVGSDGAIVNNFRRVSTGWKERIADDHYREGTDFPVFQYGGKAFSVGLCGDFWHDENVRTMEALSCDVVLWPVYTDFFWKEWNSSIKYEYAEQVMGFPADVLYVNSVCMDPEHGDDDEIARGGAVHFKNGTIVQELASGAEGVLVVEL